MKIVQARGWTPAGEYVDNSISASDARKQRPGYDQLVEDYAAGKFDALVCWDLDRLTRQPRQLEDWIDAADQRGLKLVTANGEADLTTDAGQLFASIKIAVARSEIKRKGARQSRAQRQRAEMGKPAKGVRPTGYTLAGEIIEEEAALVRRMFSRFSAGDTLRGIATDLQKDGLTTRRGGKWSSSSVRGILTNARYAGRSVYKGESVGDGSWPALVSPAQFDAVQAKLNDPRRKVNGGSTARKHIGSGLYYCGECGLRVRASGGGANGEHRYTCRELHFHRRGAPIDAYVLRVIRGRLAMPDLTGLLVTEADEQELANLNGQHSALTDRLATIEADYDSGLIDGRRYAAATEKVQVQLAAVERKRVALVAAEGPSSVLAAADPVAEFDKAPLAVRRTVIDFLAKISIGRARQGHKGFDPDTVTIEWL